jgi:hypothetical protein
MPLGNRTTTAVHGTLVYDEVVVPITDVVLEGGAVTFIGTLAGPSCLRIGGEVRIHGRDGTLLTIWPSAVEEELTLLAGHTATVHQRLILKAIDPSGRWAEGDGG